MAKRMKLVKKGTPLPGKPRYKLESSHLTEKEAERKADKVAFSPKVDDVLIIPVPKQYAVYKRSVRITPKRPKLRR